jgi:hypothetical protein
MDHAVTAFQSSYFWPRSAPAARQYHMLDSIKVDYYGTSTPISQLAGGIPPERSLVVIAPWRSTTLRRSRRLFKPRTRGSTAVGKIIRVPVPPMTKSAGATQWSSTTPEVLEGSGPRSIMFAAMETMRSRNAGQGQEGSAKDDEKQRSLEESPEDDGRRSASHGRAGTKEGSRSDAGSEPAALVVYMLTSSRVFYERRPKCETKIETGHLRREDAWNTIWKDNRAAFSHSAALDGLLRDLPELDSSRRRENTWTVFDVVGHLIYADRERLAAARQRILQFGEGQPFDPFDRLGHAKRIPGQEPAQLLDEFAAVRGGCLNDLRALNLQPEQMTNGGATRLSAR